MKTSIETRGRQALEQARRHLTDKEHNDLLRYTDTLPLLLLKLAEVENEMRLAGLEQDALLRTDNRVEIDV